MTTIGIDVKQEDFIAQLLRHIDEGDSNKAVEKLIAVESMSDRLGSLISLIGATDGEWSDLKSLLQHVALMYNITLFTSTSMPYSLRSMSDQYIDPKLARNFAIASELVSKLVTELTSASELASASKDPSELARDFAIHIIIASDLGFELGGFCIPPRKCLVEII